MLGMITAGVHLSNENPYQTIWARGPKDQQSSGRPIEEPSFGNLQGLERFSNVKITRTSEVLEFKNLDSNGLNDLLGFLFGNRKKQKQRQAETSQSASSFDREYSYHDGLRELPVWDGGDK
jgi:hypothetical protein